MFTENRKVKNKFIQLVFLGMPYDCYDINNLNIAQVNHFEMEFTVCNERRQSSFETFHEPKMKSI